MTYLPGKFPASETTLTATFTLPSSTATTDPFAPTGSGGTVTANRTGLWIVRMSADTTQRAARTFVHVRLYVAGSVVRDCGPWQTVYSSGVLPLEVSWKGTLNSGQAASGDGWQWTSDAGNAAPALVVTVTATFVPTPANPQ